LTAKLDSKLNLVFYAALVLIVLGVVFGVASIYPVTTTQTQTSIIIDDTFHLSPGEIHRQTIGAFEGNENLTLTATGSDVFTKEFSLSTYNGSSYTQTTSQNITYRFQPKATYYEAVFATNQSGTVHFQAIVERPQLLYPYAALSTAGKALFVGGLALAALAFLRGGLSRLICSSGNNPVLPSVDGVGRRRLLVLVVVSLAFWFLAVAVLLPTFAPNSLGTLENWYTDHARHSYVSSLFLKDGFSVFGHPLGTLASQDCSVYKFVTWPDMPHLYPLGSIFLFLPFAVLLQGGVLPLLVFQLEIALFLLAAHVCLYFFLKHYLKEPMCPALKWVGAAIIYVALVLYAADGMFDSVAFLFSLLAVIMFMRGRLDRFYLFIAVSIFFKYQMAIFLFPLIVVGILMLLKNNRLGRLLRNWAVVLGTVLLLVCCVTAYMSASYIADTRPEMIMNGINAFSHRPEIPWLTQASAVLFTLAATVTYALYMLNRNRLLSLSALFLLLPSFFLSFFQNWYIPFVFVNILFVQSRKEGSATMLWLCVLIGVLYLGGLTFNFEQILGNIAAFFGS
jgi:hypothetical protein